LGDLLMIEWGELTSFKDYLSFETSSLPPLFTH